MNLSNSDNTKHRRPLQYWLRVIHRDLGYLVVGFCMVYAISGIMLNHLDGSDPAYSVDSVEIQLEPNLSAKDVKNNIDDATKVIDNDNGIYTLILRGGTGTYNSTTGVAKYETYSRRTFIYWINKLHYNKLSGWHWAGDFFAISLIVLAISGAFMNNGKTGFLGRGKWFVAVGILIPILYILFN